MSDVTLFMEMGKLKGQYDKMVKDLDDIKDIITTLSSDVAKIQKDASYAEMKQKRRKILDFSDKISEGRFPSKESVDDILETYDQYEAYIKQNNLINGRVDMAIDFIRQYYNTHFLIKEN